MTYKEALTIYQTKDISDDDQKAIVKILKRKINLKLIVSLTISLVILSVAVLFLFLKGGRFSGQTTKIFFFTVLITTVLLTIGIGVYHFYHREKLSYYQKTFKFVDLFFFILIVINVFFFLQTFIFRTAKVVHRSMEETLYDGDTVIVLQYPQTFKNDDIVVIDANLIPLLNDNEKENYYVKRIKGVAGDKISYQVMGNNTIKFQLNDYEEIISNERSYYESLKEIVDSLENGIIPNNMFFLIGDNFENSKDSREFGLVEREVILGRVKIRLFPSFGVIK